MTALPVDGSGVGSEDGTVREPWLFRSVPLGRIAVLRTLVYVFVFVDV